MIRTVCLFLVMTMVLSLFAGCSSEKMEGSEAIVATQSAVEMTAPVALEESQEIQFLLQQDWVPESIKQNLDETIRWNEMLDMLANVITLCNTSGLESWNTIVRSNEDKMQRDDGMLAIYEAACALGIGHQARGNWLEVNSFYNTQGIWETGFTPREDVFSNIHEISPYEPNPGWEPQWNYITGAQFYSLGQSSVANAEPFFDHVESKKGFNDALTRRDAILAADKLRQAYQVTKSGGYGIEATNWDDPLLADAKAARESILNSPTNITKGEELILGETYTGNAYFVSNSGNDHANGLTPETAWATLNKVEKANLKYGDAVFFERGGTWYGRLRMKHGVTYSAYGAGAKPTITGSPQDAAQEDKWTLYAETADGGKIWQYAEETEDCGVILFNGGEVVARKAYPLWNGQEYVHADGTAYVMEAELADLEFLPAVDLRGVQLWDNIEGDGRKGPLYLRCDAGNPGEVYEKIEMAVISSATTTALEGWNAIDNLHFRCYTVSGMDCNCHDNIVYQNCEAAWCGGGLKSYQQSIYNSDRISVQISGGGMLLFGSNLLGRNNYIHDCENKGIAIVINGSDGDGHASTNRMNILTEGNIIERCGSSVYMWVGNIGADEAWKYENITFRNNHFVNGNYGWRQRNMLDMEDNYGQLINFNAVRATGDVSFEGNLFYRAAGVLINQQGQDLIEEAFTPIMRDNTYVQDKGQVLYAKLDSNSDYAVAATSDQDLMETCIREYIGDDTGEVIIHE